MTEHEALLCLVVRLVLFCTSTYAAISVEMIQLNLSFVPNATWTMANLCFGRIIPPAVALVKMHALKIHTHSLSP